MAKRSAVKVTPSTGNVFRDLGFSNQESEHLLVRADLLIQLQKASAAKGLKQAEAARGDGVRLLATSAFQCLGAASMSTGVRLRTASAGNLSVDIGVSVAFRSLTRC
jgi:predicted XRE-type DNA-binding protein